jgi:peptidoglycan/xylan/chitin deacetylase (PgdA/CDA1 family)
MTQGSFIISLDFELHWGVRDVVRVSEKKDYFLRARDAIPEMLRIFKEHEVHATWATVGFLFARDKRHLLDHLPELRPTYTERRLDPYSFLEEIGEDERSDPFHYAPSLLHAIGEVPGQEIASHTFSHYYCLEDGQTEQAFEADLRAAAAIGEPFGKVTEALVFPRGQYNPAYDSALGRLGVRTYRIPPAFYPYRPRRADEENLAQRGLRLLDSYVPIGGFYGDRPSPDASGAVPLRAGVFLRPYSQSRRRLESIRIHRIKRAMRDAAQRGHDFHLWWHPHNFGLNTSENLAMLGAVLEEHGSLLDRYGWPSRNMGEAARVVQGLQ